MHAASGIRSASRRDLFATLKGIPSRVSARYTIGRRETVYIFCKFAEAIPQACKFAQLELATNRFVSLTVIDFARGTKLLQCLLRIAAQTFLLASKLNKS